MVTYDHLYPFKHQTWIRPLDEWTTSRFTEISEEAYELILRTTVSSEYQQQVLDRKMNRKKHGSS